MKLCFLSVAVLASFINVSSASANGASCGEIVGEFKCTDVLSPNSFDLSISTYEQAGSIGFSIAGSNKKIQFLTDGKDYVQENNSSILRNASGVCSQGGLNILEQVTNRSTGSQYKIVQALQSKGGAGTYFQYDVETTRRDSSTSPWLSPAPEKFLCFRK